MYEALKKSQDEGNEILFFGNSDPLCPHCAAVYDIEEHGNYELHEEGEHEITCSFCDLDFTVNTFIVRSFSTLEQSECQ